MTDLDRREVQKMRVCCKPISPSGGKRSFQINILDRWTSATFDNQMSAGAGQQSGQCVAM